MILDVIAFAPSPAAMRNEVPEIMGSACAKMPASSEFEGVTVKLNGWESKGRNVMLNGEGACAFSSWERDHLIKRGSH